MPIKKIQIIPKKAGTHPKIFLESVLNNSIINNNKNWDVVVVDFMGAYMSAKKDELMHMVTRGEFYNLVATSTWKTYGKYVTYNHYR